MRSLSRKLTLAFLFVGIISIVLVAIFVRQQTAREFDRFVLNRSQIELQETLIKYYTENGRWDGVQTLLLHNGSNEPGRAVMAGYPTLLNANRVIIFGGSQHQIGNHLSPRESRPTIPLKLNGNIIGWILYEPLGDRGRPQLASPELSFLQNVNRATFWGMAGAIVVALLLGALLARTISRPIQELTEATQIVAQGNLGHQVPVRTQDELGNLAQSFNQMSADLARANQQRRQMTADIAHDLRTPLSVLMGYTESLSDGKLQGSPEMYRVMHKETQHLGHLIEDLRTLSLADAGELPLTRRLVAPRALLEQISAAYQIEAQRKNITLRLETAADLPHIDIDPDRMTQVLGNLMSNALRYTPEGGEIVLTAVLRTAVSQPNHALLKIKDSGPGIAPDDLPHIFNRFYRGDTARTHSGASGLGLAIARSIVQAHGGTITADSIPDQGTTFTISLPLN